MNFTVKRKMTWNGVEYFPGDPIEIADSHPRLAVAGWRSRFLAYDSAPKRSPAKSKARTK